MRRLLIIIFCVPLLVPFVPALAATVCGGVEATIEGTDGNDRLRGTPHDDVIAGLGGNDVLEGVGGNDIICGGPGHDSLEGGADDDRLFGDEGRDQFFPGDGNDESIAGQGASHLFVWSEGDDSYQGNESGSNVIDFYGAPSAVEVDLGAGTATGMGADTLSFIDHVWGSNFDDVLRGNARPNQIAGRGGNDTLEGAGGGRLSGAGPTMSVFVRGDNYFPEAGDDTIVGSSDFDAVSFFDAPSAMTVDLAQGTASGEGNDTLSGVDGLITSRNGDTVRGDDGPNAFAVAGRAELVDGRGGADLVIALYAFSGTEQVGAVIDLLDGSMLASGSTSLESIEDAWGTSKADMIRGDAGANYLKGRGGNDEIYGLGGDDQLNGGPGRHDRLRGGAGQDTCVQGENVEGCET